MKALRDLSLAYKTPLRISVLVIVTALLVTASLVLRERDELRRDLIGHSEGVARVLAHTLVDPIVHDDVWRAYEIINAPFHAAPGQAMVPAAEVVLVLDARHLIYVSTRPAEYPMLVDPGTVDAELASVQSQIDNASSAAPTALVTPRAGKLFVVLPIVSDGVEIGTLVMGYAAGVFKPRFAALAQRAALVTAAVLAVLLPAGWLFGRRVARPLVELAAAMSRVQAATVDQMHYQHGYRGRDEIGRLGLEFQRMLTGLREREALARQMIAADRLAAIGRLTAGIAHEINNPLGGMLNAINTFKRHGSADAVAARTAALIERGLMQIRETVAALLVEARVESHALTRQDLDDLRTLALAEAQAQSVQLAWHADIAAPLALPSTPTRQILINLLLNAVKAAGRGGHVQCRTTLADGELRIEVVNDGSHIAKERLPYLFEPFSAAAEDGGEGHGLGLWVSYQIVQQLGGRIAAASEPGRTVFTVTLPVEAHHESASSAAAVPG